MKKLAQVISYVVHPLLLPTYVYALVFLNNPIYLKEREQYLILTGLIFFITFFIPAWVTYLLYKLGIVKSMKLTELKERRIPFLITAILYVFGSYLMSQVTFLTKEFVVFMYCIALNVTITGFVSSRWKISAHAVGAGGVLGVLTYVNFTTPYLFFQVAFLVAILVVGALLWARLYLGAHTQKQVYVGLVGSFLTCFLLPYFLI